jgi:glucokinase
MTRTYIGIDLGGTKIGGAIYQAHQKEIIFQKVIPTNAVEGPDAVLDRIASFIDDLCREGEVSKSEVGGVGLGLPATIDFEAGAPELMPNLPGAWSGKPVVSILQKLCGQPVALINDAHAFTLAEATLGAGVGSQTVVCFTIGTGIGGGIAIDGSVHQGLDGRSGIFGHHTIDPNGPLCGCGNHGCMEALASGPAITSRAIKAVLQGLNTKISTIVDNDIRKITPHTIQQAAEEDDPIAKNILETSGTYLGIGIANVITILSPNCVVIGGGVSHLGEWILQPIVDEVRRRCFTAPIDKIKVQLAQLGPNAGMIGAAIWASQKAGQATHPFA